MRVRSRSALAAVALALAGCEDPQAESGGWTTTVDTLPGGAVRVLHTPPDDGVEATWVLEEELRIGTREGDGPAGFGQLMGLAVTRDGRIAVVDRVSQELGVFDEAGRHLATFGGEGGGPGELRAGFGLMVDQEDLLWVPDFDNARMSVFDPASGVLRTYPLVILSRGFVWSGTMTAEGHIHKPSITLEPPRRRLLRVYDGSMVQVDSMFLPTPPETDRRNPPNAFYWEASDGTRSGYQQIPFYPLGIEVGDRSGARWSRATGDPSYRITRWIPGGDTILVIETTRSPVPVPEAVRDSAIDAVRERLRERGGASQDWSRVPEVWPAVQQIFPTRQGGVWVETASPDSLRRYDVYDGTGAYSGTVATSLNVFSWIPPTIRGDRIWAVVTDELDVPYVVRARLVPAPRS